MVIEALVGVPLITPVVEFNVRPGPGDWFPSIDQIKGGVPATAANVTLNGTLTVPFIGEPVVIVNTVGPGGGGGGAGAVETSLQPLKPDVAARKKRTVLKRFGLGFQCGASMSPLCFRRYDITAA